MTYLPGVVAFVLFATSCGKEMPVGGLMQPESLIKTEFRFALEPVCYAMTKAEDVNDDNDDFVDSIDLYEFDANGSLTTHKRWENPEGIDFENFEYSSYGPYNSKKTWVFFANLDKTSADYFAQLAPSKFSKAPECVIPLEAGNFRLHKPLMGGTARSDFKKNETLNVSLCRYMTKIVIKNITADFDDEEYFNKDVKLKKIVILSAPNALRLLYFPVTKIIGTSADILNTGYTIFVSTFGNLSHFNTDVNAEITNDIDKYFNPGAFGGSGILSKSFPYCLNYNYKMSKGELRVTAEGDQKIATSHIFGESEGVLCSSTGKNTGCTVAVNKVLYTFPWSYSVTGNICGSYDTQCKSQKIAIEVEIDGEPYFYIIPLQNLEAGMIYNVNNINIKGLGSEYSNFYERHYVADFYPLTIQGWSQTDIDNIDLGYKDNKTEIY